MRVAFLVNFVVEPTRAKDAERDGCTGSARRRRERRLRQWNRHERMTDAMALAESTHHSAPRGQKTARTGGEGGAREELHGRAPGEALPPGGWRAVLLYGRRRGRASRRAACTSGGGAATRKAGAALWQRL